MKKLLIANIIILSVIIFSSFSSTDVISNSNDIVGTWNYSVPNAPYDYQKGELILEEKEGKLSGYTKVGEFKNEIEKPKLEDNNLKFTMYIEGTDVSFDLNFKKNKFTGIVTYFEGSLDITGVKTE